MRKSRTCPLAAIICAAAAGSAQAAVLFQGIGDLTGGTTSSLANAVSGDGLVAVGQSNSGAMGNEAASWTSVGGIVGLGASQNGFTFTAANGASHDGSVIVGNGVGPNGSEAIRHAGASRQGVGDLTGGIFFSIATGVSRDGSFVVGQSASGQGDEAIIWSEANNIRSLGDLPGATVNSIARAVDPTGTYVVGRGRSLTPTNPATNRFEAALWTVSGTTATVLGLGDLPHTKPLNTIYESEARGISDDALVIVGYGHGDGNASTSAGAYEAVRWIANTVGGPFTAQRLGDLSGGAFQSQANAVSADGDVVVGSSNISRNAQDPAHNEAFLWRGDLGMVALKDHLLAINPALSSVLAGWTLTDATGISEDGTTIVGMGSHPLSSEDPTIVNEGWIVTIPEPASLSAFVLGAGLMRRRRA